MGARVRMAARKAIAWGAILTGLVLMLSGWWLHSPDHASAFGVSSDAWWLDFVMGFLILVIGGIAKAGHEPLV